jgi:hypothetical protein
MKTIKQLFRESACFGEAGADALFGEGEPDTLPPMTVAIGALCEDGKAVVLAADRQVSHLAFGMRGEGPDCKIAIIPPGVLLAAAGEPPSGSFLDSLKKDSSSQQSAPGMAKLVAKACVELWRERVEQAFLWRYAQKDYASFLEAAGRGELPPDIVKDIWGMVKQSPMDGMSFLVGGTGEQRAELYAVVEPDGTRSLDSPGFGAIGAGSNLAMAVLYQNQNIKHMGLPQAVYTVYEAKKAAESTFHVGKATDMAVILGRF